MNKCRLHFAAFLLFFVYLCGSLHITGFAYTTVIPGSYYSLSSGTLMYIGAEVWENDQMYFYSSGTGSLAGQNEELYGMLTPWENGQYLFVEESGRGTLTIRITDSGFSVTDYTSAMGDEDFFLSYCGDYIIQAEDSYEYDESDYYSLSSGVYRCDNYNTGGHILMTVSDPVDGAVPVVLDAYDYNSNYLYSVSLNVFMTEDGSYEGISPADQLQLILTPDYGNIWCSAYSNNSEYEENFTGFYFEASIDDEAETNEESIRYIYRLYAEQYLTPEHGYNASYSYYYDIDGDGIEEFFFFHQGGVRTACTIFTYYDGVVTKILRSFGVAEILRNPKGNKILIVGSQGAADSIMSEYKMTDGPQLSEVERYSYTDDYGSFSTTGEQLIKYYHDDIEISEDDFYRETSKYSKWESAADGEDTGFRSYEDSFYSAGDPVEEYFFPDIASRYMTNGEINELSLQQVCYAKNEVYAIHGRRFLSKELREYFESRSWYFGEIDPEDFSDSVFNDYERGNVNALARREEELAPGGYQLDQPGYYILSGEPLG